MSNHKKIGKVGTTKLIIKIDFGWKNQRLQETQNYREYQIETDYFIRLYGDLTQPKCKFWLD